MQGEMVDCIEHLVGQAVDYLDEGTGELIEAHRYAEKARRVSKNEVADCCFIFSG